MIEIVIRDGPPEALTCAAFICDHCRGQVVKSGNVLYAVRHNVGQQRESSPLLVSHKECTRAVEMWLKARYPYEAGWLDCWEEASHFVRHLVNNLTHSFADDSDGEYPSQRIVLPACATSANPLSATESQDPASPGVTDTTEIEP